VVSRGLLEYKVNAPNDLAQKTVCPGLSREDKNVPVERTFVRLKPFPAVFRRLPAFFSDRVEIEINNLICFGEHVPPGVWLICSRELVGRLTGKASSSSSEAQAGRVRAILGEIRERCPETFEAPVGV
jgi:hypothetical protein